MSEPIIGFVPDKTGVGGAAVRFSPWIAAASAESTGLTTDTQNRVVVLWRHGLRADTDFVQLEIRGQFVFDSVFVSYLDTQAGELT